MNRKDTKRAWKAAQYSAFLIPGAGQIYNRQWLKGVFLAIVFLIASMAVLVPITLAYINHFMAFNGELPNQSIFTFETLWKMKYPLITLSILCGIIYVYSIVDALKEGKNNRG